MARMIRDVSVEYAHIYTNQHISQEQEASLQVLGALQETLAAQRKRSALVVMVDDYSFPDPTFSYTHFTSWLAQRGCTPDFLVRESQLIPLCDEVIHLLHNKTLRTQITDYVRAKKYPCSLFIAAWYLARLGKLRSPLIPPELVAKSLLNILPESFKPFEDKGLEIIKATPYAESVESIRYTFLPGRVTA